MCKQDFQIWRRVKSRFHTGLSTGAQLVLTLPEDRSRVGLIVLTPNSGSLRVSTRQAFNSNHEVIQCGSGESKAVQLTWRDYGPLLWEEFTAYTTVLSSWTIVEQFLDVSDRELEHYLRVDL